MGVVVLAGWLFDIPGLTHLYLPGPTMKTNGAVCLIFGGLANLLLMPRRRRGWRIAACALAVVPVAAAALTLSEHIVGWDLGIDQLIATEAPGALATMSPNRMGPPASFVNLLLGLALLIRGLSPVRGRTHSLLLAFVATVVALLPLVGYAYGFTELYAVARFTGISLGMSLTLLILALAVQAAEPQAGLTGLMSRDDEVGVLTRRLLPAAIILPFGIGWLLARMFGAGFVDAAFAISAMALVPVVLLAALIWNTGVQLIRSLDARAETERALSESERSLRESDQQKTEFLATLSHELRNPLAPIRFAVELLNGPPAAADRARRTIERQVQHLTRLIDDLLDLTRITRNKLALHVRPTELRQLVADAVDAVSNEIRDANHSLQVQLPQQRIWVNADPDRLVQILVNLLNNASRYSEAGARIVVGAKIDSADVILFVRDSGHGLEPADLTRVFERFVQIGNTRHGGLGLGLALVKALVELHGGTVEARSEGLGLGSEFLVRLPRAADPLLDAVVPSVPAAHNGRILIVDDNRDAADMLAALLTESGHEVRVAYDGHEALRDAATFKPQVALLDIGMPGMNGYELAAQLRGDAGLSELFLVAITGWGQEEDRRRALAAGFDAHMTKPADPAQLSSLLAARFSA